MRASPASMPACAIILPMRSSDLHGFTLTARTTQSGCRKGLVIAIDLEQYDYSRGSKSRVRATEGTILSRIPPRQKVRRGAPLESPHVMLLIDDKDRTVIEPLYAALSAKEPAYDAQLHQNMGRLTGWAVTDEALLTQVSDALTALDNARAADAGLRCADRAGQCPRRRTPVCCW